MSATKYFYALGQRSRAWGWSKHFAEAVYRIDTAKDFARIAFDKGYRGL